MPRKTKPAVQAAPLETTTATSVAELDATQPPATEVPTRIEGPQGAESNNDGPANPEAKNWGNPYKAIFVSREMGFELGEHRRFKQRVFLFAERPNEQVLAKLKENGFVYRAAEKAWTIPANPDSRRLSDDLAQEFAGKSEGMIR